MSLKKNTAGQKWIVFAWTIATNVALAGDAANITANLRLDGGGANAVDDTNPAELEDGFYAFDLTAAETNADNIVICPASATGGVAVVGCPMACWTETSVWDESLNSHKTKTTFGGLQTLVSKWDITANQLLLYAYDDTLLYTFDLTRDGEATEYNPDKRTPA